MHEDELEAFSRGAKGIGGRQRLSPKEENKGKMDIWHVIDWWHVLTKVNI